MSDPNQEPQTIKGLDLNNIPPPISTNYGRKNIPLQLIADLKSKNYSNSQIATILKCDPSNITKRLQDIDITKDYITNKSFLIRHLERRVYYHFTDAKLKKANAQQLGILYGTIYDKGQLEEGKSTQNIAYADVVRAMNQEKMTLDKLKEIHNKRHNV